MQRVDHQHVVALHRRQRPRVVVAGDDLDRLPVVDAQLQVDPPDQHVDLVEIAHVLLDAQARGDQQGEEAHPPAQLRVLLQQDAVRLEAADDVLARLHPVDAQDRLLAEEVVQQEVLLLGRARIGGAAHRRHVDRDRVGARPRLAPIEPHRPRPVVDLRVGEERLAGAQEGARPALGLEADDVAGAERAADLLDHLAREEAPVVGVRPGDVDEELDQRVGDRAANRRRRQVEVVVLQQDHRRPAGTPRLVHHRLGEQLVHHRVPLAPGAVRLAIDVRRARGVPQVVLHEPEQRVGDHVVIALVGFRVGGHELQPVAEARPGLLDRRAVRLRRALAVACAHRRRHPDRVRQPADRAHRRHHAARAALRAQPPAGRPVLDRPAVGRDHQIAPLQHLRDQPPQTRPHRARRPRRRPPPGAIRVHAHQPAPSPPRRAATPPCPPARAVPG